MPGPRIDRAKASYDYYSKVAPGLSKRHPQSPLNALVKPRIICLFSSTVEHATTTPHSFNTIPSPQPQTVNRRHTFFIRYGLQNPSSLYARFITNSFHSAPSKFEDVPVFVSPSRCELRRRSAGEEASGRFQRRVSTLSLFFSPAP